ncbi:hypothetical protein QBC43DRAFT_355662 [Cladorrhinum sp. PSN259]|nr:hypothetical protein QBC43DRAFT_355662 [Cladorrhinum sp. PSN259]
METVERLELLNGVITAGNGCWRMARQMLDALPDHEIDTPCPHTKVSILYAAVGRLWDILGADMAPARDQFIHHLIEFRGAGIHTALTPLALNPDKALAWESRASYLSDFCRFQKQGLTMTPLLLAVYLSANDADLQTWVERMLLLQPIRGNAQANKMLYLHKAVGMHTVLDDPYEKPLRFNCKQAKKRTGVVATPPRCLPQQRVIRALLAAGADRTQLDDDGNTPLSLMLSWLTKRKEVVQHCCELIRPLSMGVDVNRQNSAKRSIVSYLEELIQCDEEVDGSNNAARCIMGHLEIVKLENGDREIKWLRG